MNLSDDQLKALPLPEFQQKCKKIYDFCLNYILLSERKHCEMEWGGIVHRKELTWDNLSYVWNQMIKFLRKSIQNEFEILHTQMIERREQEVITIDSDEDEEMALPKTKSAKKN